MLIHLSGDVRPSPQLHAGTARAGRSIATPLLTPMFVVLSVAIAVTCLVVAYSTWSWRLARAESLDGSASDDADEDALARSGGGA